MSDQDHFLRLLRQGDEKAYRKLFDDYFEMLCRMASGWVHDDYAAQSVVSDTLFRLWQSRETITITTSLRSYLIRSVRNSSINYLQSEYKRREIPVSYTQTEWDAYCQLSDLSLQPHGTLEEKELQMQLKTAIDRLPVETRQVFRLCRLEGKTYHEAATTLNISVNTVKYHLKSALKRLAHELAHYLPHLAGILISLFSEK